MVTDPEEEFSKNLNTKHDIISNRLNNENSALGPLSDYKDHHLFNREGTLNEEEMIMEQNEMTEQQQKSTIEMSMSNFNTRNEVNQQEMTADFRNQSNKLPTI